MVTQLVAEIKKQLDLGTVVVDDETHRLRIYADPMFSRVIYNLMDNSLQHGGNVSRIHLMVRAGVENCTLVYADDGVGIPSGDKEKIFNRVPRRNTGIGLFLVREILSITGITIIENGQEGRGAQFEISIPRGKFNLNPTN